MIPLCAAAFASGADAKRKKKKKLSLAQLAALEWKLEQATTALGTDASAQKRKQSLASLATIDDPRVIKPLAMSLREDPDPSVRRKAAELLVRFRTPEVKGLLLLTSMADPDAQLREQAKTALETFPRRMKPAQLLLGTQPYKAPSKVTDSAIKTALSLPSGAARLWAVSQLAENKKLGKREYLLKSSLHKDPSSRVRVAAAQALATLGKVQLPELIKAIGDGDPKVRFAVARALATFDDAAVLRILRQIGSQDKNATVRAEVKDLLEPSTVIGRRLLKERIAKLSAANPAKRIAALNALSKFSHWRAMVPMACALLRDKSTLVRTAAADVLTNMHDSSILTAMRAAALIEPDKNLKKRVRRLLKGLRKRVDVLIRKLEHKDPQERIRAVRLLGQAAYPPALAPLIATMKDKEARVRRAAARALTGFSSKKAKDALKAASADADKQVRLLAAQFIKNDNALAGWRRFYKNVNRMVAKTFDKSATWRKDAAIALGIAGAERAAINLIQLLKNDKDENVRLAAAWSLVLMGSDSAEKALRTAAGKDKSQRVQLTARKYLVIEKVSIDDLRTQLGDKNEQVRSDAAEALSLRASGSVAYDLAKAAMCDASAQVRASSLRGLARIANPLAKTVLRSAMRRDGDENVRRTALVMYILAGGK
jgi:HEAT repeat protein